MKPRILIRSRNCGTSIEKRPKNLDGSKIYRDSIKKVKSTGKIPRWIEDLSMFLLRLKKKARQKWNLSRICREAVELEENEFFKEEKYKEIKATSKQLNQRSNQHVKLSKHLSAYMQAIHTSNTHTHTHTHTHARTHTTSLTNFIFQKQVKTVQ